MWSTHESRKCGLTYFGEEEEEEEEEVEEEEEEEEEEGREGDSLLLVAKKGLAIGVGKEKKRSPT